MKPVIVIELHKGCIVRLHANQNMNIHILDRDMDNDNIILTDPDTIVNIIDNKYLKYIIGK